MDVLIGPEKITIRHRIPVRDTNPAAGQPARELGTEGDHSPGYPLRWGRARADPGTRRSERVEENVGADAIELSAGQLDRLDDVEPPVGDRYADMTPVNR